MTQFLDELPGWSLFTFRILLRQSLHRWPSFLQQRHDVFEISSLFSLYLANVIVILGMGSSAYFSMPLSSSSLSRWATIWLYVPFSGYANSIDFFKWVGILAYRKLSIKCWDWSRNACSANSFSSSKLCESEFVFGSKVSLCHLCLAFACDSSLTSFRRNTMRTFWEILLLVAIMFRNVCNASFL